MSKNKVRKTISLNRNDPGDLEIIKKISQPGFNFNLYVRKLMLDDVRREKTRVVQNESGGIKIILD